MKRSVGFALVLLVYTLLNVYIGWNGWVWLRTWIPVQHPWIYSGVLLILAYAYVIGQLYRPLALLRVIGACWFAVFQYALILLPVTNLAVFILSLFDLPRDAVILLAGDVVLLTLFVLGCLGVYNAYRPIVREYQIDLTDKRVGNAVVQPETNEQHKRRKSNAYRFLIASDMHFGHLSGRTHAERLVRLINARKPSLILFVGDLIDDDPYPFMRKGIGDVLQRLKAPMGVYGVLGNHEYYGGEIPAFLKEMERIGVKILLDETVNVDEQFYLVGRKDRTDRRRKRIEDLLRNLDQNRPIIMMDHQPNALEEALAAGVDVYLSGHTHRGQMAPNHWFTRRIFELDWGYVRKQRMHVIVSSGYGFWGPPIRIGSRSEIIQLEINMPESIDNGTQKQSTSLNPL